MSNLAPIVFFVYNRPVHTARTIEHLKQNIGAQDSELFIFSDGAKKQASEENVKKTREIIHSIQGFKKVYIFEKLQNAGLANSVIAGVSEIINQYGKAIVVEDDLITSPNFLPFMNAALNKYESQQQIFSISGYSYPVQVPSNYKQEVYLARRGSSWGWACWADRWNTIDWEVEDFNLLVNDKKQKLAFNEIGDDMFDMLQKQQNKTIDSWAIRFAYAAYKNNTYHILPVVSKVQNIGHDNSGRHSKRTSKFEVILDNRNAVNELPDTVAYNEDINQQIYDLMKYSFIKKVKKTVRKIFKI